jgi:hypothetical protein
LAHHQPFQVTAFHSCDKEIGLKVLNGKAELNHSSNRWDWLGEGIYFWEQNPLRALEYAIESAQGNQFNKIPIKTPFVLGATIELGNCLNLIEPQSLAVLNEAYSEMVRLSKIAGQKMPVNKGNNRALDCSVIKFVHQSRKETGEPPFDTIRCAFIEGDEVYPGASFTSRGHIQICVLNDDLIRAYFLPRPLEKYNPYLNKEFKQEA